MCGVHVGAIGCLDGDWLLGDMFVDNKGVDHEEVHSVGYS